ncbi:lasso peptide [Nostoc sp. FACHB-280]|uniref:lasso peptide n=1 Tax=Nostoc sp. FACHB-280 TaxID=2692839 RepID=UPI00168BC749|nr:lasso peptide [Nostoc sp. FACHB-280]MBD2494856.1 lasso peptide [Nostoc sp. FACHB-280]
MKKAYEAPKLTNYGSVENVTHAFGTPGPKDTFQIGNNPTQIPGEVLGLDGSQNGVLIPQP